MRWININIAISINSTNHQTIVVRPNEIAEQVPNTIVRPDQDVRALSINEIRVIPPRLPVSNDDRYRSTSLESENRFSDDASYEIPKAAIALIVNSLKVPDYTGSRDDEFIQMFYVIPKVKPLHAFMLHRRGGPWDAKASWAVSDSAGAARKSTIVMDVGADNIDPNNKPIWVEFCPPLEPTGDGYRLIARQLVQDSMEGLREQKHDWILSRWTRPVRATQFEIVIFLPDTNLFQNVRTKDFSLQDVGFTPVAGRPMTTWELANSICGLAPMGMRSFGWIWGKGLGSNEQCGIELILLDP
jgi:hypothetical protein